MVFPLNIHQASFWVGHMAGGRDPTDLTGPALSFPSPNNLSNTENILVYTYLYICPVIWVE